MKARTRSAAHGVGAQPVELVHRAQHRQLLTLGRHAGCRHQPVQELAAVDPHNGLARRQARGLQGLGGHGDDLGVGLRAGRAHRICVALDELAEPARAGLLVAPHRPERIAPERLGQGLPALGGEPGQRRGEVIAQRHPLLVVVLQGKDALVGTVGVRQELAQRIGIFQRASLQELEPIALIDLGNGHQNLPLGGQVAGAAVGEAARGAGLRSGAVGGHGAHLARAGRRLKAGRVSIVGSLEIEGRRRELVVDTKPRPHGRGSVGVASGHAIQNRSREGRMVVVAVVMRETAHGRGL